MNKKVMSLGLVGVLTTTLMVGCNSNDKDDDTITIKYVDENGNVKREKVTKEEAKKIENDQKQQVTKDNTTKDNSTKKETTKEHKQQPKEDRTNDDYNYDDLFYGNAARGTCPDCGRNGMVFNHGDGLKCAYCGFYDPYYYVDEEPDQSIDYSNKEDEYTPNDNNYDDYDETQDYEESPSEPIEEDVN